MNKKLIQSNLTNEFNFISLNEKFEKIIETLNHKIDDTSYVSKIDSIKSDLESKIAKTELDSSLENQEDRLKKHSDQSISKLKNEISQQFNELRDKNIALANSLKNVIKKEDERKIMQGFNCNKVITFMHDNYWCAKSEYILNGAFEAKISIIKINEKNALESWDYAIGLIKNTPSYKDNQYYNDSICLYSNGLINKKFQGNIGAQLFDLIWKIGDIILVKRDNLNNIYFGINNETKLAYKDITGPFKIVFGYSKNVKDGDIFELNDLNDT